ncbi:MAG: hypothetical protein Q8880_08095 [Bacteroidota bacterium]|nr:hypothetical protein [Bacteroidota bacterium]
MAENPLIFFSNFFNEDYYADIFLYSYLEICVQQINNLKKYNTPVCFESIVIVNVKHGIKNVFSDLDFQLALIEFDCANDKYILPVFSEFIQRQKNFIIEDINKLILNSNNNEIVVNLIKIAEYYKTKINIRSGYSCSAIVTDSLCEIINYLQTFLKSETSINSEQNSVKRVGEGSALVKTSNLTKKSENKQEYHSFRLIIPDEDLKAEAIANAFDFLTREYDINYNKQPTKRIFIDKSITRSPTFSNIFSGNKISTKVNWTGTESELVYFIKKLKENNLIEDLNKSIWDVTDKCFLINNQPINNIKSLHESKLTNLQSQSLLNKAIHFFKV